MARVSTVVVPKPEFDALVAENARLRENQCLICEYPADHDQQLCVTELARLREALEQIAALPPGTHWLGFTCQDIARNALKETT